MPTPILPRLIISTSPPSHKNADSKNSPPKSSGHLSPGLSHQLSMPIPTDSPVRRSGESDRSDTASILSSLSALSTRSTNSIRSVIGTLKEIGEKIEEIGEKVGDQVQKIISRSSRQTPGSPKDYSKLSHMWRHPQEPLPEGMSLDDYKAWKTRQDAKLVREAAQRCKNTKGRKALLRIAKKMLKPTEQSSSFSATRKGPTSTSRADQKYKFKITN